MAEAGRGDLDPKIKGDIEKILKREAGDDLASLNSLVIKDVEGSIEEAEEIRSLYVGLNKSLERLRIKKHPSNSKYKKNIKGDVVGGVGIVIAYVTKPKDPSQESKIEIEIKHDKDNKDNALRTTIILGNKGTAFYERQHTPESGWKMITEGLSEDAGSPLPDIKRVVGMFENVPSKSK